MDIYDQIVKPTLMLNVTQTRANISKMINKARDIGVELRPHFKTHQSAEIGEWYKDQGIRKITVSSIDMAAYFASSGWEDITIAFPVNIRRLPEINDLAGKIRLGILVENLESMEFLAAHLDHPVFLWIKVDPGYRRTGIPWENTSQILSLIKRAASCEQFILKGLLAHAGQTYQAHGVEEICRIHSESMERLRRVKEELTRNGYPNLELSPGDTPACSVCSDFSGSSEIRPGNFVFYDVQQYLIGSCQVDEISTALACPVVAKHPERQEVVIHGGAVHLSKDNFKDEGITKYGLVAFPAQNGWSRPVPGAYVARLSQEHGIIHFETGIEKINIGDILCILPAHICLTVTLMRNYLTLDGKVISTMNSQAI